MLLVGPVDYLEVVYTPTEMDWVVLRMRCVEGIERDRVIVNFLMTCAWTIKQRVIQILFEKCRAVSSAA